MLSDEVRRQAIADSAKLATELKNANHQQRTADWLMQMLAYLTSTGPAGEDHKLTLHLRLYNATWKQELTIPNEADIAPIVNTAIGKAVYAAKVAYEAAVKQEITECLRQHDVIIARVLNIPNDNDTRQPRGIRLSTKELEAIGDRIEAGIETAERAMNEVSTPVV